MIQTAVRTVRSVVRAGSDSYFCARCLGLAAEATDRLADTKPEDLPPKYAKFMESGYLQSMKQLRNTLLEEEWRSHGKLEAQRAAIAQFEEMCAQEGFLRGPRMEDSRSSVGGTDKEKAQPSTPHVTYDVITALYDNPDDLFVVKDDVLRARLRAKMTVVVDQRLREAYRDATKRAEDMSKFLKEGPGSILEALQKILPLPGFLKK